MTFIGIYLGASFVSGQEIYQFFGVFGGYGIAGMAVAVFVFYFWLYDYAHFPPHGHPGF